MSDLHGRMAQDTAERTPREALSDAGISDPTPELIRMAESALEEAREAVADDPDADSDTAHEIADSLAMSYGLEEIAGSIDALEYSSELTSPDAGIRERATTIAYEIARYIAASEIDNARPSMADVDWSDAHPRRGYVLIGKSEDLGFVYIAATIRQREHGPEVSIVGDYRHGGGQIDGSVSPDDFEPAPDYTRDEIERLWAIWDRWHLNGMRAYCEHQRQIAVKLGKKPHEVFATSFELEHPDRDVPSYDAMHGKQITTARVTCPICSYNYGSSWLFETPPADVLAFLRERFHATDE